MPLRLVAPSDKRRTPFWYIRGTLYGRTIEASTKARDRKSAQKFKERFELELAKEDQQKRSPATFRIAAEQYKAFRKPNKADAKWIDRLTGLIGEYQLSDIRQSVLIEAANELFPDAANATKNRQCLTLAAAVLHYAAENGLCAHITVRKFKEKAAEPRALSKEDAAKLMDASTGAMHLLLTWLFYQGWRISDVLRLQWSDINTREGTVRYHIRKTDEYRVMPLHKRTHAALLDMEDRVGRVFPWANKSNLYRRLRPFCAEVGVRFTPHMARHSFATWLANEGVSPLELMEAGGWRDHKSVLRYAKLDPTRVRSVINKIG